MNGPAGSSKRKTYDAVPHPPPPPAPRRRLSVLSSVAFMTLGVADHSVFMIVSSALFLALPLAQAAHKRHGTPQVR